MNATLPPIRVLVVEDSLTIRRWLVELVSGAPGFSVVGEAGDGRSAIALCEALRPDVISMDMILPQVTGVAATEHIMAYCPTPILVVSSSINRGELFQTYDALAAGAVDVLEKPRADGTDEAWALRYLSHLRLVSKIRVITHPRARLPRPPSPATAVTVRAPRRLVAIGASTGGPSAVLTVLRSLGAGFPLPILLVIHISEPFGLALADWLDAQTPFRVRYAIDGEAVPAPGTATVCMAPPGRHLVIEGGRLRLTGDPERWSCRPSVDVLFESIAATDASGVIACLLTGMGKDGARGLLELRRRNALTIAQDEATSVVFGMPGEAVRLGAATHVLPLGDIGPHLARLASAKPAGDLDG